MLVLPARLLGALLNMMGTQLNLGGPPFFLQRELPHRFSGLGFRVYPNETSPRIFAGEELMGYQDARAPIEGSADSLSGSDCVRSLG